MIIYAYSYFEYIWMLDWLGWDASLFLGDNVYLVYSLLIIYQISRSSFASMILAAAFADMNRTCDTTWMCIPSIVIGLLYNAHFNPEIRRWPFDVTGFYSNLMVIFSTQYKMSLVNHMNKTYIIIIAKKNRNTYKSPPPKITVGPRASSIFSLKLISHCTGRRENLKETMKFPMKSGFL